MANKKFEIILTDKRVMRGELLAEHAPLSCANFEKLVAAKFFDGLCFHRVIPGFMIQGGGMIFDATAKSATQKLREKHWNQTVKGEFKFNGVPNQLKHTPGVLSMARTNVMDSGTSQFFLCVADCVSLDGQYAGFGKLSDQESIDIAVAISKVPTTTVGYHDDVPVQPIVIETVKFVA
ncbi:MAG: peptidylprolyl isomerase [Firmicutes bacterium]|nr:peptidylprolyl isomerase [Bacillota bacterium]